jgi:signal transduction histidine kinase/CheY-like chemotaxis protein
MVLIPSIVTSIIVCTVAISSLQFISRRNQLAELEKIASTVSESVYDKIDSTALEELSRIVFDIGKFHNVIIIITSPDDEPVASYPAVTSLIDKSLSFDLVYKHPIQLRDGTLLGRVVIKRSKQLFMGLNDITLLVGAIVAIFMGSWVWHLKFSKPMVSDILNLSLHNGIEKKFRFKEIRDINNLLKKQSQELNDLAVNKVIVQMTQMLAHDTRRPFTMVEGVLTLLESSLDRKESKEIARQYTPEVRKALQAVNDMLSDIMEVGSNKPPKKEPADIESVIDSTLNDCFRFNAQADITFEYRFRHLHLLDVDRLKIGRVLINIVNNAAQAMDYKGRISFRTHEIDHKMIVTVGNTGSYIPPKEREKLFDAFYTKNKKKGTGLGLAIARKIVNAHGGRISCRSDFENGTEFVFSLPIAENHLATSSIKLPDNAAAVINTKVSAEGPATPSGIDDTQLERKILASGKQIHILIADDAPLYCKALQEQIDQSAVKNAVRLTFSESGEEAVASATRSAPDIIIIDIDFGDRGKMDGFEAVRKIRASGNKSKICIHSNRGALELQADAVNAGCDLFLPKPMTKSHLLAILAAGIGPLNAPVSGKLSRLAAREPELMSFFSQYWIHGI